MTSIFSRWKGPGLIINRILVASRQASTNLSVSIPEIWTRYMEVANVTGRSHILIHVGNTAAADVIGCIAIGMGLFPQLQGVSSSKQAIENFYLMTAGLEKEEIIIRDGVLT